MFMIASVFASKLFPQNIFSFTIDFGNSLILVTRQITFDSLHPYLRHIMRLELETLFLTFSCFEFHIRIFGCAQSYIRDDKLRPLPFS